MNLAAGEKDIYSLYYNIIYNNFQLSCITEVNQWLFTIIFLFAHTWIWKLHPHQITRLQNPGSPLLLPSCNPTRWPIFRTQGVQSATKMHPYQMICLQGVEASCQAAYPVDYLSPEYQGAQSSHQGPRTSTRNPDVNPIPGQWVHHILTSYFLLCHALPT